MGSADARPVGSCVRRCARRITRAGATRLHLSLSNRSGPCVHTCDVLRVSFVICAADLARTRFVARFRAGRVSFVTRAADLARTVDVRRTGIRSSTRAHGRRIVRIAFFGARASYVARRGTSIVHGGCDDQSGDARSAQANHSRAVSVGINRPRTILPPLNHTAHRGGTEANAIVTFGGSAEISPITTHAGERSSKGCDGTDQTHCNTRERKYRSVSSWNGCRAGAPRRFSDGIQRRSPHSRCETNTCFFAGRETARRVDRYRGPNAHTRRRIQADAATHVHTDGAARAARAASTTTGGQSASSHRDGGNRWTCWCIGRIQHTGRVRHV